MRCFETRGAQSDLHVQRLALELFYKVNSPTWNCKWQGQVVQGLLSMAENKWKASSHILEPSGTDRGHCVEEGETVRPVQPFTWKKWQELLTRGQHFTPVPLVLWRLLVLGRTLDLNVLHDNRAVNRERVQCICKAVISLRSLLRGEGEGSVWGKRDLLSCFYIWSDSKIYIYLSGWGCWSLMWCVKS